jgi:hypothetical protein
VRGNRYCGQGLFGLFFGAEGALLFPRSCFIHRFLKEKNLNPASNEFLASVENHLYAVGALPQLSAEELDIVNDFALQEFGAGACAGHIKAQRAAAD